MKKTTIILILIIFSIISIIASIEAMNQHHLDNCYREDCDVCVIINSAINLLKNINYFIKYINIIHIIAILIISIKIIQIQNKLDTLINKKVQFNE